jgi:hypothetical protein
VALARFLLHAGTMKAGRYSTSQPTQAPMHKGYAGAQKI